MTGHIKIGGTWTDVDSIYARVGGSWKDVDAGYLKVSGAWEEFYTSGPPPLTVDYLVIAGGGGGGRVNGGGGAGGYRSSVSGESSGGGASAESSLSLTTGTNYTVTVGAGGIAGNPAGNGSNSVFSTITSTGGGGGGAFGTGATGGSGGGAGYNNGVGGAGTTNQGYAGGERDNSVPNPKYGGGGGGGAGSVGGNGSGADGGAGGSGVSSSITGSSVARAGGGGAGGGSSGNAGDQGDGGSATAGGGQGATYPGTGTAGTTNTGGGGGGGGVNEVGSASSAAANGGSGVVIIKYPDAYAISVGAGLTSSTSTSGGYAVTTFTAGTGNISFVVPVAFSADYLVIAGGGAGGDVGAGGGAGGYRTSTETSGGNSSAETALTLYTSSSYTVTVGAGGAWVNLGQGNNGSNSVFSTITSDGGGGGGSNQSGAYDGRNGGSGGGARSDYSGVAGTATANQGFDGSSSEFGGGGGAGGTGESPGSAATGAYGGVGLASSITGSSVFRAGGGGSVSTSTTALGGNGGGGNGGIYPAAGQDGTANTGGGGGGGVQSYGGGNGGSGIVIVKYPDTQTISVGAGLTSSTDLSSVPGYRITSFTAGTGSVSFQLAGTPPAFLTSAPLWLDASDASTITESSGAVSQWDNKGTGSNLVQATASYQPTTGVTTINGLNVLDFNGSALVNGGTIGEYNFMHNGGKFFVAAVVDWLPEPDANNFLIGTRINASAVTGYAIRNDNRTSMGRTNRLITDISRGVAGTLAAEIVEDNYFNSGPLIFSSMVDADASTGSRILYYQNSTQGSNTNTRTDAPSSSTSSYKLTVGAAGDLNDNMTGSVAEIVVVNGADATEANRQAVVQYLNEKWGVF